MDVTGDICVPWPDAAKLLQYREGEPWCVAKGEWNKSKELVCGSDYWPEIHEVEPLHRLAAILCDDAEAFRVLHWCVTNLSR